MGICIKSLKTFVFMLETAISLLESYPKEKESDNHKGVIYEDIPSKSHLKGLIPVSLPLLKIFLEMCLELDT